MKSHIVQDDIEANELRDITIITFHTLHFLAVCEAKSIGGGAQLMGTTTRSIRNHIRWMQCLTGEKLLQDVIPGQTMQLSEFGEMLWNGMKNDLLVTIKKLNKTKMDGVTGKSFTDVIKSPYYTYKPPKNHDPVALTTSSNKRTDQRPQDKTDEE